MTPRLRHFPERSFVKMGSHGRSGGSASSCPEGGEKARRAVKGDARRTEEDVLEKANEARAALDEMIERGKHVLAEKAADG